jgi:uncharacterized phage infection (PIP) family protein YhgE
MWLPNKLHELLPYIYAVAGLIMFYSFNTAIGYVSGLLFMLTAILVWLVRIDQQAGKTPKQRKPRH